MKKLFYLIFMAGFSLALIATIYLVGSDLIAGAASGAPETGYGIVAGTFTGIFALIFLAIGMRIRKSIRNSSPKF